MMFHCGGLKKAVLFFNVVCAIQSSGFLHRNPLGLQRGATRKTCSSLRGQASAFGGELTEFKSREIAERAFRNLINDFREDLSDEEQDSLFRAICQSVYITQQHKRRRGYRLEDVYSDWRERESLTSEILRGEETAETSGSGKGKRWSPLGVGDRGNNGKSGRWNPAFKLYERLVSLPELGDFSPVQRWFERVFSFAVPSEDSVEALTQWIKEGARGNTAECVDFGAGSGYWAALLNKRGVKMHACDPQVRGDIPVGRWYDVNREQGGAFLRSLSSSSPASSGDGRNEDVGEKEEGDRGSANRKGGREGSDGCTLLLVWPTLNQLRSAVTNFGGNRVAIVGEDEKGVTANLLTHSEFLLEGALPLNHWPGQHDAVWLFRRAPKENPSVFGHDARLEALVRGKLELARMDPFFFGSACRLNGLAQMGLEREEEGGEMEDGIGMDGDVSGGIERGDRRSTAEKLEEVERRSGGALSPSPVCLGGGGFVRGRASSSESVGADSDFHYVLQPCSVPVEPVQRFLSEAKMLEWGVDGEDVEDETVGEEEEEEEEGGYGGMEMMSFVGSSGQKLRRPALEVSAGGGRQLEAEEEGTGFEGDFVETVDDSQGRGGEEMEEEESNGEEEEAVEGLDERLFFDKAESNDSSLSLSLFDCLSALNLVSEGGMTVDEFEALSHPSELPKPSTLLLRIERERLTLRGALQCSEGDLQELGFPMGSRKLLMELLQNVKANQRGLRLEQKLNSSKLFSSA
uniref:SAM domain-containing protein n=1 Tax=Chromera velia CCMP2878 TaxID=1169474 RepID=A0A0G4G521_9ALVE|eukprot:Cvel_4189.t1-p1 / transcript=Cvel_4189.t1 / gene=Cvel_4189 / organism=Chromera_velia_CCMP2878 / gene_product=hypothetical protein / transcript_product=hypothetical protein / location=Cvel_scaffold180:112757-116207(-) / protein_length=745 / sequence_SO=supercontig / SO=protein_coding / is_pseudo=false